MTIQISKQRGKSSKGKRLNDRSLVSFKNSNDTNCHKENITLFPLQTKKNSHDEDDRHKNVIVAFTLFKNLSLSQSKVCSNWAALVRFPSLETRRNPGNFLTKEEKGFNEAKRTLIFFLCLFLSFFPHLDSVHLIASYSCLMLFVPLLQIKCDLSWDGIYDQDKSGILD